MQQLEQPWQAQIGSQRDWAWRGWKIRYTYIRSAKRGTSQDQTPLVLLHGFGSGIGHWRHNLMPLSQHHSIYALDLLGFGASEKAAAAYKADLWVAQVYDFWRTWINQPIVLVGHSLGALVALTAAINHPEMVQSLVLLTLPASRQELLPPWLQPLVGTMEGMFASPLLLKPLFRLLVRRPQTIRSILKLAYANPELISDELVAILAAATQDRRAAGAFSQLSRSRTRIDFSESTKVLLPKLQVPTLMLWGEKDKIIPPHWGRQFSQLNSNLKLVEIAEAGHCLYDECPERVNQEVLNWIEEFANQGEANAELIEKPS